MNFKVRIEELNTDEKKKNVRSNSFFSSEFDKSKQINFKGDVQ